jgi:hypothetical protein
MPRFVVLEHDYPEVHWDLMLECGPVLRTWRLSAPPVPPQTLRAEKSFDHRAMYLEYEGPVSGGRGRVTRWDAGSYNWENQRADDPEACGRVVFAGAVLRGAGVLEPAGSGDSWLLTVA